MKFPDFRVFVILWVILICYLTFDFINDAKKDFLQFNYDWNKIEIIDMVEKVTIDSISHDYLEVKNNFEIPKTFNNLNSFSLDSKRKSYFRTSEIIIKDSTIVFSGVKWINHIPKKDLENTSIEVIDLPLIQFDGKTTTTIGDSQIIWRQARGLRKELSLKNNLFFVGKKTDVFGYPYEGGTFDTTRDLLKLIPDIEPTAYYILFFGAQDKAMDKNQLSKNICEILNLLTKKKNVERILAITLPPSSNPKFNKYNQDFNALLLDCAKVHSNIKIVNLYNYLEDKQDYLTEDAVHLNDKGYLFLNKLLRNKLQ